MSVRNMQQASQLYKDTMPIAATIVVLRSSSLSIPVIPAPKNILVEAVVIAELELGRAPKPASAS